MKNSLLLLGIAMLFLAFTFTSCKKETCSDGKLNNGEVEIDCGGIVCAACISCFDGVQNQNETGIDCGGVCDPCATCSDGIKNQDETGIDCGGSCPSCPLCNNVLFTASINSSNYVPNSIGSVYEHNFGITIITQNAALEQITVFIDSSMIVGTYPLYGDVSDPTRCGGRFTVGAANAIYLAYTGSVTIDHHYKDIHEISGSFSFEAEPLINATDTASISNGIFCVQYAVL